MVLRQFDMEMRAPWPTNPDGYYYWTSVYYYDTALEPNPFYIYTRVFQVFEFTQLNTVQVTGYQIKEPPGRGNVIEFEPTGGTVGLIPPGSDGDYMGMAVRWDMVSSTGRKTRKTFRVPLREQDISGGLLTAGIKAIMGGAIVYYLASGIFTDSYGDLIVSATVAPEARQWQLRHGTKRRERRPIV